MVWGFLFTGLSLLALILLCLFEIHRVDRIIERVDRDLGRPEEPKDRP